ncbi:MAG TPA: hypothetical protein VMZ50_09670, partial [Phycisphaerae bacterium]|nr:hypothetical protein [Phycisphaerae bacterium]
VPIDVAEIPRHVESLVRQLGATRWRDRETATQELARLGKPIADLLRQNVNHEDPEVQIRVRGVLRGFGALPE